jgi:hypothetical protein
VEEAFEVFLRRSLEEELDGFERVPVVLEEFPTSWYLERCVAFGFYSPLLVVALLSAREAQYRHVPGGRRSGHPMAKGIGLVERDLKGIAEVSSQMRLHVRNRATAIVRGARNPGRQ